MNKIIIILKLYELNNYFFKITGLTIFFFLKIQIQIKHNDIVVILHIINDLHKQNN